MIDLEVVDKKNMAELQKLLIKCSDYLTVQDGKPVGADAAEQLLISKPEEVSAENKIVFGIYNKHALVGVIDVITHYAGPGIINLGLLVIEPSSRGNGIGELAHQKLENWARHNNFSRIRLGVLLANEKGRRFWQRVGYGETGEIKPYLSHMIRVMEKSI